MRAERLCVALPLIILLTAMWKLVSSVAEMHWSYGSTLHADRTSPLSAWCCWKSCHCWDARVAGGSSPGQTLLGCVRGKHMVSHSAVCQEQAALVLRYVQLFTEVALAVFTQLKHCRIFRATMCGFGQELCPALSAHPHVFWGKGVLMYFQEWLQQL